MQDMFGNNNDLYKNLSHLYGQHTVSIEQTNNTDDTANTDTTDTNEPIIVPLDIDQFIQENNVRQVTSARLFAKEGKNPIPDINGLYSPEIFGIPEDEQTYRSRYGYIQLPFYIVHPVFVDKVYFKTALFIDFFRIANSGIIVSKDASELYFFDELTHELKQEYKADKYIIIDNTNLLMRREIQYLLFKAKANQGSKFYSKLLQIIDKYGFKLMFTNKLLVIPAAFRSYSVSKDGKIQVDELTNKYAQLIHESENFTFSKSSVYKILLAIRNVLNHLSSKFLGKQGALRQKIASKRINFSARSVIVPDPNLEIDTLGIPLKVAIELFLPELIHHLLRYHARELDELNIKRSVTEVQKLLRKIAKGYYLKPGWHEKVQDLIIKVLKEEVLPNAVVVFKRDPSIWKHSWLAARPVLNDDPTDDTFHLHPLYCSPLGADFDGDSALTEVKLEVELKDGHIVHVLTHISKLEALTVDVLKGQ